MDNIHFGKRIKEFLEQQDGGLVQAAEKLDITYTAIFPIFKKEDVNTKILRLVSIAYNVPMTNFFEAENNNKINKVGEPVAEYTNSKIAILEAEKKGLEAENKLLREMVEILKKDK